MKKFKINKISDIYSKIYLSHKKLNSKIVGGYFLNSKDNRVIDNNFTLKKDLILSSSGGISNLDLLFYYGLFEIIKPKNILIIGNSYGYSSLSFALMMPNTKIISMEKYRVNGIKFTNKLTKNLSNITTIKASSPDDLVNIKNKYFKSKIDVILCDSVHMNNFIEKEFEILQKIIKKIGVIIYRGYVLNNDLTFYKYNFFKKIIKNKNYIYFLNNKSSSGNGLIFKKEIKKEIKYKSLKKYLNYFCEKKSIIFKFKNLLNNKKNFKFQFPKHPQL